MWLEIDERTDILASLSLCSLSLNGISKYPARWKWLILALHNSLQGAMVCHLSGTAQLGALSKHCVEVSLEWHDRDRRGEIIRVKNGKDEFGLTLMRIQKKKDFPPIEYLANPEVLFERLHNISIRCEPGCGSLISITDVEQKSFNKLNAFRNELTHFTPKGWSIEIIGLASMALDIVGVIKKISTDPWPFRHMKQTDLKQLDHALSRLQKKLEKLVA